VLPNVPTGIEQGVPNLEAYTWNAIFLPKGAPAEMVNKLNRATVEATQSANVRERLPPVHATPEYLARRRAQAAALLPPRFSQAAVPWNYARAVVRTRFAGAPISPAWPPPNNACGACGDAGSFGKRTGSPLGFDPSPRVLSPPRGDYPCTRQV
jgi:hypothetical protein